MNSIAQFVGWVTITTAALGTSILIINGIYISYTESLYKLWYLGAIVANKKADRLEQPVLHRDPRLTPIIRKYYKKRCLPVYILNDQEFFDKFGQHKCVEKNCTNRRIIGDYCCTHAPWDNNEPVEWEEEESK